MDQAKIARLPSWRSFGLRRVLAVAMAVAAALAAVVYLPGRFSAVDGQVSLYAGLSHDDRVLRGARGTDVDTGIFYLARQVIPPGAPYLVTTGSGVDVSNSVTLAGASALGALFLLPRIQVNDPRLASYVISYGGDLGSLGVKIGRVWTYKQGLQVAEVAR